MSHWNHELTLTPEFDQCVSGSITVQKLAQIAVERIKKLPGCLHGQWLSDVLAQMESVSKTDTADRDAFDEAIDALYNWADVNKVWVKTF